jgi:c(7)-type cytochrome triheme protein
MKKTVILIVMAVCIALAVGSALAVPPGKTLDYAGGAMGKVTFDGKTHGDAGNKCNDCHTKVLQMKMGAAKITAADHVPGKFCGSCHDGTKAFAQKGNCTKCHVK